VSKYAEVIRSLAALSSLKEEQWVLRLRPEAAWLFSQFPECEVRDGIAYGLDEIIDKYFVEEK
jgi:hypothetical protein